jgi:hypothetical protein
LKEVVFFKLLEYAALDFDKLIGNKQSKEGMVVRVDCDIQRK